MRQGSILLFSLFGCLGLVSESVAGFQPIRRSSIESRSYVHAAPRIRFTALFEGREMTGWLAIATDSTLIVSIKGPGGAEHPWPSDIQEAFGPNFEPWNAKDLVVISNHNITKLEIDESSRRDLADRPIRRGPARPSTVGGGNINPDYMVYGLATAGLLALCMILSK